MSAVFLSYARDDAFIARQLMEDLVSVGIDVWSDARLTPGSDWAVEITRQLEEAAAVVVLISRASIESKWVIKEWTSAIHRSARVIPVLVGGATHRDLPLGLRNIQFVDLGADYTAALASIISAVRDLVGSTEPPASESVDVARVAEDIVKRVLDGLGISPNRPLPQMGETQDNKLIFVICSFLPDMEPIFEAISAAAISVDLRAERVKDIIGDYRITEKMLSMIRRARFIVADLTHERPNVYFELGYARGIGKTVITILREGTERHFDIYDWTHISYMDSRPLERLLIERFEHEVAQSPPGLL